MKNFLIGAAGMLAGSAILFAATPAGAVSVDINVNLPGVYTQSQPVYAQPRPAYIQPQYEQEWRERQTRAAEWRDAQHDHGHAISAAAHQRNDARKENKRKHKSRKKYDH